MSNHTNDPWETEMSRTFDQRVRDLHEAPLDLDQVKGRAGKIRRNRRIAVAGGVLAVAAVVVPIAVFAGGALDDNSSPPIANPDSPGQSATDPEGLGFSYLEGETLHLADGSTVELSQRYDGGVVLGEAVYAVRNDDDTGYDQLDVVDASGTRTLATDVVSGPVLNDDGTALVYIQRDGTASVEGLDSGSAFSIDAGDGGYVTAFTGGPDCESDDCRIYVNGEFGTDPMVYDGNGGSEVAVPDVIKVNGVEGGLVAVQNESTDTGSCGGVYDLTLTEYHFRTCDYYVYGPSPDGKYVEATHPYLDGFGNSWAAILDSRTGNEVARLEPERGAAITQTAWQDPANLLVRVFDGAAWNIYRLGTDGSQERVLGPAIGSSEVPAYSLLD